MMRWLRDNYCAQLIGFSALLLTSPIFAQQLITYTEFSGPYALGFPVPKPIDSLTPVDGYRSYQSLHARHQQLAADSIYNQAEVVGSTIKNRSIWAYTMSDGDSKTWSGLPEPSMLVNGGIHAREWQSPEAVTAVIERLMEHQNDQGFHQFLLENANIIILPVLNIDGFLQTQRFHNQAWLGKDPRFANDWPRDGRMRRKNMRSTDEDLFSLGDHLGGIDLNRNHPPFWASSGGSSPNPNDLTYHGSSSRSEPESQALLNAMELGPLEQLRLYLDVHSFTKKFFTPLTNNNTRNLLTNQLVSKMIGVLSALGNPYVFQNTGPGGIGTTTEFPAESLEIPSYTLELEPGSGAGTEYGGFGANHDGFIMPASEVDRMRQEISQALLLGFYNQYGPPAVATISIYNTFDGQPLYQASWQTMDSQSRELIVNQQQALYSGETYRLKIVFDKPMRWQQDGQVMNYLGQSVDLNPQINLTVGEEIVTAENFAWPLSNLDSVEHFERYQGDTLIATFTLPTDITTNTSVDIDIVAEDLSGLALDSNPTTVTTWQNGGWVNYENSQGEDSIVGGKDASYQVEITNVENFGVTQGLYWNPAKNGHGYQIVRTANNTIAVFMYTYDQAGNPWWYLVSGTPLDGRHISGSIDVYDRENGKVTPTSVGEMQIDFIDDTHAILRWEINGETGIETIELLEFGLEQGTLTGAWADLNSLGYGMSIAEQSPLAALVLYFYDAEGNPRWAMGIGSGVGIYEMESYQGYCIHCEVIELNKQIIGVIDVVDIVTNQLQLNIDVSYPGIEGGNWIRNNVTMDRLSESVQ